MALCSGRVLRVLLERLLLLPLAHLAPRRVDLLVFGSSRDGFDGNSRHLYLWASEHAPDLTCVWVTGDRRLCDELRRYGLRAELRWSWRGLWTSMRASVHLVNNDGSDTHSGAADGARIFDLWHGVGIKNIRRGSSVGTVAERHSQRVRLLRWLRSAHELRRPDLVLSTSPTMSQHFARCFDIPVDRCPVLGYPRLDPLLDEQLRRSSLRFGPYEALLSRLQSFDHVYLYAPTMRARAEDPSSQVIPDWAALSAALRPTRGVLLLKLHPVNARRATESVDGYDNVLAWPDGLDLAPVLDQIDCLITDYSSLLYDYLAFADHGVVIYTPDHESFQRSERDLAFDFDANVIGVRADDFASLCAALTSGEALAALAVDRLAQLRQRFWGSTQAVRPASGEILDRARQLARQR